VHVRTTGFAALAQAMSMAVTSLIRPGLRDLHQTSSIWPQLHFPSRHLATAVSSTIPQLAAPGIHFYRRALDGSTRSQKRLKSLEVASRDR
jgi:hypothetical protein